MRRWVVRTSVAVPVALASLALGATGAQAHPNGDEGVVSTVSATVAGGLDTGCELASGVVTTALDVAGQLAGAVGL
ncbi:hypothetical protein I5Q34_03945 [Streptomyces sp. AV19]|uniref:hypothetical protein n=1 Tax=Streptomyces sp. AV19 TaxID=2793068 RepID=UPI0018FE1F2F|nr:hypothetical protein [Streptomyces sp. AV19]MBH1933446.1 hypothetical protein [Streptomyces sp. AV19]MDG4532095.1 hypothetical protein [Streptomyces sp. AV19]